MAPILRRLRGRICRFVKLVTGDEKSRSLTNGFLGCWLGLAEKEGFEPSVGSPLRLISSQVHSTTLPLLLIRCRLSKREFYQGRSSAKPPM